MIRSAFGLDERGRAGPSGSESIREGRMRRYAIWMLAVGAAVTGVSCGDSPTVIPSPAPPITTLPTQPSPSPSPSPSPVAPGVHVRSRVRWRASPSRRASCAPTAYRPTSSSGRGRTGTKSFASTGPSRTASTSTPTSATPTAGSPATKATSRWRVVDDSGGDRHRQQLAPRRRVHLALQHRAGRPRGDHRDRGRAGRGQVLPLAVGVGLSSRAASDRHHERQRDRPRLPLHLQGQRHLRRGALPEAVSGSPDQPTATS